MSRFQFITANLVLITLLGFASCQSPIHTLTGEYSYKISGQVNIGNTSTCVLNDEIGSLNIIHKTDSIYILTFNTLNGGVYHTEATLSGKELTLDEFQRTLSVTYTENSDTFIGNATGSLYTDNFSITVRGNGILYDQTIIFDLQYSGKQLDKQQSLRGNNITLIAKKN